MDIEILKNQLDWVQARMEDMDQVVINYDVKDKGYEEALKNLNKLTDRYDELLDRIEHFDDVNVDAEKVKLEAEKLKLEADKLTLEKSRIESNQELEQDKINLETEKLRLEREKFASDVEQAKKKETIDIIFKTSDVIVKLAVPILGFAGVRYVANLSYMNDEQMKLCNGRIAGGVKDMLKIMTMKV